MRETIERGPVFIFYSETRLEEMAAASATPDLIDKEMASALATPELICKHLNSLTKTRPEVEYGEILAIKWTKKSSP